MQKTTQYSHAVSGITRQARIFNSDIGNYVEHYINDQFQIVVRLSNGRIQIPTECAQDFEVSPASVDSARIASIANTFKSNELKATPTQSESRPEIRTRKSIWRSMFEMLGLDK